MEKILLVGQDFHLLATRASVISSLAATVTCCNEREFSEHIEVGDFGLVVLCHSLSADLRTKVTQATRGRCSRARILQIATGYENIAIADGVDAVSSAEPGLLLKQISQLLTHPLAVA